MMIHGPQMKNIGKDAVYGIKKDANMFEISAWDPFLFWTYHRLNLEFVLISTTFHRRLLW